MRLLLVMCTGQILAEWMTDSAQAPFANNSLVSSTFFWSVFVFAGASGAKPAVFNNAKSSNFANSPKSICCVHIVKTATLRNAFYYFWI